MNNNDAIHEKWNIEWNKKYDSIEETSSDTWPCKENSRCRNDETATNRLRSGHTLLNHGYLMKGLPVINCELYHSHVITVKHLLTD